MSRTRENLLGYLLGALEPAEVAEIDEQLENNQELRRELAAMEAALTPLGFPERDDDASFESPPGDLVASTCDLVDDAREMLQPRDMEPPTPLVALSPEPAAAPGGRTRWADVIVVASVIAACVALLFPAIWSSRQSAQVLACQDNLRYLGLQLTNVAAMSPDSRYTLVPIEGPRSAAGIYGPDLQDRELLESPRRLVCPASPLAEQEGMYRVPTLPELDRATGEVLARFHRMMGGSYAFNMGYFENGRHVAPRHEGRSHYAMLADAPATFRPQRQTKNHNGRGQNIMYDDGSIKFVVNISDELADDPYLNRSGIVAAGLDCTDAVLGESNAKPLPLLLRTIY
jgi:hypothetical protein